MDPFLQKYTADLVSKYGFNNKILLIQLPQFMFGGFNPDVIKKRGAYIWPPAGIQWLSSALKDRGLSIRLMDLNYEILRAVHEDAHFTLEKWPTLLDRVLLDFEPSLIGLSTINVSADPEDPNYPLRAVMDYLKDLDRHIVMAGGPNAGNDSDYFLKNDLAHFIFKGEGDLRIKRVLDLMQNKDSLVPPQSGICFKWDGVIREDGESFSVVKPAGDIIDTYAQVPIETYHHFGSLNPFSRMAGQDKPFATLQLNRGCRADCEFCGVTEFMGGRGVRALKSSDVIREVDYLVRERSIRHFELLDDDFLGKRNDRANLISFLKALTVLRQEFDLTWSAGNGLIASSIDDEIMDLIHSSGCIGFRIGIESGNDEMIRKMRKPASLNSLMKSNRFMRKYPDILVSGNFILGIFGEETFGQMIDSFLFNRDMALDWAGYTVFQFTHTSETKEKKKKEFGAEDFVPTKGQANREIMDQSGLYSGLAVFDMDPHEVPSREQVKQIWQSFTLVSNYIDNPNLKPGGNPQKYANWLHSIYLGYPDNVYMPLFLSLTQLLLAQPDKATDYLNQCRQNLDKSPLWRRKLPEFDLMEFIEQPCQSPKEVYARLDEISQRVLDKLPRAQKRLRA